jgi:hypothetical protein
VRKLIDALTWAVSHGLEVRFVAGLEGGPVHVKEQLRLTATGLISYELLDGEEVGEPVGSRPWNGPSTREFSPPKGLPPKAVMILWMDVESYV